jgi:hypothetical protein
MRCIHGFSVETRATDNGKTSRKGQNNIKMFFMKWGGARSGQVAGACDSGNERSGSVKCGEYLN